RVTIFVGSVTKLEFVWNFSDIANALMAIPNLIALLLLYKVVVAETHAYFNTCPNNPHACQPTPAR
uniref:alanine:cation symporter family protein n=1 Tax=Helicobacter bizzozeronii TaxID=56877 RepID=UPI0018F853F2